MKKIVFSLVVVFTLLFGVQSVSAITFESCYDVCKKSCNGIDTSTLEGVTQMGNCTNTCGQTCQNIINGIENGPVDSEDSEDSTTIEDELSDELIECYTTCNKPVYSDEYIKNCMLNCTEQYGKPTLPGLIPDIDLGTNSSEDELSWGDKIQCGDLKVPYIFPSIVNTVLTIIKVAVPVIIIILGSVDLLKAVMAQKDDEIKKGQQTFIRRLIVGAAVFLVFAIVQLVIGLVAPQTDVDNSNMWSCVNCFVNGDCKTQ